MPRKSPATTPTIAAPKGPSKPPANNKGMAEKTISAEPGASAGTPGGGRVEADVSLNPMNKLVSAISIKKAKKNGDRLGFLV